MGSPCMESMQNKTLPLSPLHPFSHKTYPTKLDIKRRGNINLWSDDRYTRGASVGLWPSSPVCSLCPSSPACLLQRSFTRKTLGMPPKEKTMCMAGYWLVTERESPKLQSIRINLCGHSKYHGVTSTRQHQAGHYSVKHLCQASLTSSFQS